MSERAQIAQRLFNFCKENEADLGTMAGAQLAKGNRCRAFDFEVEHSFKGHAEIYGPHYIFFSITGPLVVEGVQARFKNEEDAHEFLRLLFEEEDEAVYEMSVQSWK